MLYGLGSCVGCYLVVLSLILMSRKFVFTADLCTLCLLFFVAPLVAFASPGATWGYLEANSGLS